MLFGFFILIRRDEKSDPSPWYVQAPILFSIFIGYFYKSINPTP